MLSHKTQNQLSALGSSALEYESISTFQQSVTPKLESMFDASGSAFFHWAGSDNDPGKFDESDLYFPQWNLFQKKQYLEQVRHNDPVLKWLYNGAYTTTNGVIRITSLVRPRDYLRALYIRSFFVP